MNRGLEQIAECPCAEALEQHRPAAHTAGHRDRAGTDDRYAAESAPPELVQRRPGARSARAVEEVHAPALRVVVEAEEIAPDAATVGLRHAEDRVDGDRGVRGGAAPLQDLDARQRRERMGRRDHRGGAERDGAMRVADVGHPGSGSAEDPGDLVLREDRHRPR